MVKKDIKEKIERSYIKSMMGGFLKKDSLAIKRNFLLYSEFAEHDKLKYPNIYDAVCKCVEKYLE